MEFTAKLGENVKITKVSKKTHDESKIRQHKMA